MTDRVGEPGIPVEVRTDRLRLPLITRDEAADMAAGRRHPSWDQAFPREDDVDGASMIQPEVEGSNGHTWGSRFIVRSFDGLVVGSIGFFGPPSRGSDDVWETEVGYGLVESARGHGAATEALRKLLEVTDTARVRIRASVEPDNRASIRVLAKCGFTDLRGSDDEGHLVMARPLPA